MSADLVLSFIAGLNVGCFLMLAAALLDERMRKDK